MFLNTTDRISLENERAEAVGRLLIVGFEGCDFTEVENLILEIRPAGLIFFKRNYPGRPEALRRLIEKAQDLALRHLNRRLLMVIDHEGGLVQRLPEPYTQLPSAAQASIINEDAQVASEPAAQGARELAATGFNFNMAPVLDVAPEGGGFIGSRSFGPMVGRITDMGRAYLAAFRAAGVLGAAKHFPGLGEAVIDPHHELPLMEVGLARLEEKDLRPFRDLIASGLPAVMTTHALYPALDPDHPATFSARIVDLVKNRPDFEGAVLTDDLEMGAVVKHYPMGQAAVAAIEAGHDLALVCRRRDYIDECRQALVAAVSGGRLSPERLADARRRSAKLLAELELIRPDDQTLNEWFGRLAESDAEE